MNKITALLAAIKAALMDRITADTAILISQLAKLEAKVEKAIAKDLRKLKELTAAEKAIASAKQVTNKNVDAAYKLLHNVTSLTR